MKKERFVLAFFTGCLISAVSLQAQTSKDSTKVARSYAINEVVVTGTRSETDVRHLPMTVSVVGRSQLEASQQTSVLPVLNSQVPGFFSTSRGVMGYGVATGASGQMSLRGIGGPAQAALPTTGLLVLIDGHPQYMGLMGHPIADAYQTMMAERVEVLRGPASVLYGSNAMGGVINIVTRKMQEDGIRTNINIGAGAYGSVQTEATNRIRKGRFSSTVTASYNRTDGHRADMAFEQYGGYAKLGYDFTDNWKVWGDVNVTRFNATNPGSVMKPYIDNDQRITRGMTSFALENHYEKTSGALSFFYNWGDHWINDGYQPGGEPLQYRFNSNDQMLGVSWYQSIQLFQGNRLTVGADYFHFGGEAWNQFFDGHRETSADKSLNEVAGYVDFRQDIAAWLTLDAGARVDYHSQTGTEFIPQVGLAFHLPENAEIKAMASKGFRNPTIREMYMFPPQNPDLKPEKLWNYELSFSQRLMDNRLSYGLNVFYINGENLIIRLPNPNGSGMLNQNSGEIENWGAEANVGYQFNPVWSVMANYSWLHMENPVLASPEHKLYGGVNFRKGRWSASTGIQYVKGLYTDLDAATKENFVLWDMQGSFKATNYLSFYVRGENLLAQRYEINAGYPMPKATFMGGVNINF
ncbi:TonB-dependent receptor [Bacteroides intestinalis]|jgi:outer membrane cobalamin receptor|uniref:TonB-dependent receptor n=1 Tax=Bacteroides intestinalis TaxID=329854 RepID=A0AAQ0LQX1_9BACE|nr:TonB-dependent receptor [Bacteroides intestinalis]QDO69745.1 TonB-dependent receptor [Bacteroides intestinalis]RGT57166.1 TonB-dependent receptor [Bacteroides intestinalis]RGX86954.1 TonB-dependent receptor [Bacteroides intestinalis]UCB33932.1 TonB-dependent receptor [Bacteroides intestinalis]UCB38174.1 TonB-dependent receptor [Bacteroides intestinalis]